MSSFQTTTHFSGYSCQFSPFNSHKLAVATAQYYGIVGNGKLVILDLSRPTEYQEYLTKDGCFDLAWAEDNDRIVFAATGDGSIKVFDVASPSGNLPIANLVGHSAEASVCLRLEGRHAGVIYGCSWSPRDANLLATVGADGKICVHDLRMPAQAPPTVIIPHAHDGEILSCDWHKYSDGIIVTAGVDRVVRSWDVRNPTSPVCETALISSILEPLAALTLLLQVSFILGIQAAECCCDPLTDMSVIVWDLEATSAPGHLVDRFDHHSEFVYGVDMSLFTPNLAASVGWDRQVRVWDISKVHGRPLPSPVTISKMQQQSKTLLPAKLSRFMVVRENRVHKNWAVPVKAAGCCGFANSAGDYLQESHEEFLKAAKHMSKAAGLITHPKLAKVMAEAGAQAGVQGASAANSALHAIKEAKDGHML
ncbi:peroxisomal targeting signal 2 receptor [Perkinsus chesapeaki]|uniref:Peroxin-7 n=1 Tax=Perkinsus chesapeaki TaxID=330153 RepID=A0A7J6MQU6_PERCH|nr:peroxisomal targeting signal 2 receptor [Perkinsus chesapeaki]